MSEHDAVQNPAHYDLFPGQQVIDIIRASLTPEEFAGYLKGNVLKYRLRAGEKGEPIEDLGKAAKYRSWLYEERKAQHVVPTWMPGESVADYRQRIGLDPKPAAAPDGKCNVVAGCGGVAVKYGACAAHQQKENEATHRDGGGSKFKQNLEGRWMQWGLDSWFYHSDDPKAVPPGLKPLPAPVAPPPRVL